MKPWRSVRRPGLVVPASGGESIPALRVSCFVNSETVAVFPFNRREEESCAQCVPRQGGAPWVSVPWDEPGTLPTVLPLTVLHPAPPAPPHGASPRVQGSEGAVGEKALFYMKSLGGINGCQSRAIIPEIFVISNRL